MNGAAQPPEMAQEPCTCPATVAVPSLPMLDQVWQRAAVRKTVVLLVLASFWEAYGRWLADPLLFPTFSDTMAAFLDNLRNGVLATRTLLSLRVLVIGYAIGLALAALLTTVAMTSRLGADLLETLTAMLNPLPAIALLPLALIWFGLGSGSIVFVLVHSVLWAFALNAHGGFRSVSPTLRMVGQNYGLRGLRLIGFILVPAAFPAILTGIRVAWAFAWRTLIAAELVFGVSSGSGGLGWFIFENRNALETPSVFAGLLTVIVIGLFVENAVFSTVERRTIRRWGMSR